MLQYIKKRGSDLMRFSIVDRGDENSKRVADTLKKKCFSIGWQYDDEHCEIIFL